MLASERQRIGMLTDEWAGPVIVAFRVAIGPRVDLRTEWDQVGTKLESPPSLSRAAQDEERRMRRAHTPHKAMETEFG